MVTIFKKELKRSRRSLVLWSTVIGILTTFGMLEYPFISKYVDTLMPVLQGIPKIVQIVFGVYNVDLIDPIGYYICMYFWSGLIIFTHAVCTGASIVSKDERDKVSEFIYTKPYPRSSVITAKFLTGIVNIAVVAALTGSLSAIAMLPMNVDAAIFTRIAFASLGMFLTQLVLMTLGLLCSALFRTYKQALLAAVCVLMYAYTVDVKIQYNGNIEYLNFMSPLRYFPVASVTAGGISMGYFILAAVVSAVAVWFSVRTYDKRDLL